MLIHAKKFKGFTVTKNIFAQMLSEYEIYQKVSIGK